MCQPFHYPPAVLPAGGDGPGVGRQQALQVPGVPGPAEDLLDRLLVDDHPVEASQRDVTGHLDHLDTLVVGHRRFGDGPGFVAVLEVEADPGGAAGVTVFVAVLAGHGRTSASTGTS